ncbi:MAG: hypothetical protein WEA75_00115 [Acidimicrobiia bacterium]
MAVDDIRRYELHEAVRRTLGESPGDTLMELLPPVGWADVATKHDLELRLATLEAKMQATVLASEHRIVIWLVTTMAAGLAIAITVARSI